MKAFFTHKKIMVITERGFLTTIIILTAIYLIYDAFVSYFKRSLSFELERTMQLFTVVLTNLVGLPAMFVCIRREFYPEAIIGGMCLLTSTFYHVTQTAQFSIWNMNDGQWHRLDNVFVILTCQGLAYFLVFATTVEQTSYADNIESLEYHTPHFLHEQRVMNMFRWFGLAFCLTCQERAPWDVTFTIIPIIIPALLATLRMFLFVPKALRPRYNKLLLRASILFLCSVFFFVLGLDDANDYVRIKHGLWHAFVAVAFYYFFQCKDHINKKNIA
jgi:hypothetical protein